MFCFILWSMISRHPSQLQTHYIDEAGLEESSCLHIPSVWITGVCRYTWPSLEFSVFDIVPFLSSLKQ